jgi:hypothetical protein
MSSHNLQGRSGRLAGVRVDALARAVYWGCATWRGAMFAQKCAFCDHTKHARILVAVMGPCEWTVTDHSSRSSLLILIPSLRHLNSILFHWYAHRLSIVMHYLPDVVKYTGLRTIAPAFLGRRATWCGAMFA